MCALELINNDPFNKVVYPCIKQRDLKDHILLVEPVQSKLYDSQKSLCLLLSSYLPSPASSPWWNKQRRPDAQSKPQGHENTDPNASPTTIHCRDPSLVN